MGDRYFYRAVEAEERCEYLQDEIGELGQRIAALEAVQAQDRLSLESWKKRAKEAEAKLEDIEQYNTELILRANAAEVKLETATQSMLAERTRADAAKAKLAMVKKWRRECGLIRYIFAKGAEYDFDRLDTILADTLKPLAVVEGEILTNGCDTFIEAELPGYRFDWPADKYTVIVLPKEADDE